MNSRNKFKKHEQKGVLFMENTEAYKLIGDRVKEMAQNSRIQDEMMEQIKQGKTKEQVENWLYINAIGTLCGFGMTNNEIDGF